MSQIFLGCRLRHTMPVAAHPGATFRSSTRYRRYLLQEGGQNMASLIAIALGVTLVVAAISVPYRDSWYGRWSRSDR
jgi:hypothetical protein